MFATHGYAMLTANQYAVANLGLFAALIVLFVLSELDGR
jgi:hypothetical protein